MSKWFTLPIDEVFDVLNTELEKIVGMFTIDETFYKHGIPMTKCLLGESDNVDDDGGSYGGSGGGSGGESGGGSDDRSVRTDTELEDNVGSGGGDGGEGSSEHSFHSRATDIG